MDQFIGHALVTFWSLLAIALILRYTNPRSDSND